MTYQRATKSAQREQSKKLSFSQHQTSLNHVRAHPLIELQRTIGNQAVLNMLRSGNMQIDATTQALTEPRFGYDFSRIPIHSTQTAVPQTKLKVNQPGDVYEQEADQVAEQVMRMTDPESSVPDDEGEAKNSLMRKQSAEPRAKTAATGVPDVPPVVHAVPDSGGGQPLDRTTRTFMEPRFGHDFSQVRVHTDTRASNLARSVNALAFTVGQDVVFGREQYAPGIDGGRRLLAHELAHVVQQSQQPQLAAHPTIMRAVSPLPSSEELQNEIAALQMRLALLKERYPNVSNPEIVEVEKTLESKQTLAGEPDPIRQKILFYRASIRELRKQLTATPLVSSPEREKLSQSIYEYEVALAGALAANIQRLDKDIAKFRENFALDPSLQGPLNAAESELSQNESEYKTLSMIFSPEKATAIARTYAKEVTPEIAEHCMGAFYAGLGALYTPEEASTIRKETVAGSQQYDIAHKVPKGERAQTYDVDRIMSVVQANSKAGPMMTFKYNARAKGWSPNVEQTLLGLASSDCPGLYAFGVSLHGGYHSVILVVDTSQGGAPQIYWMDQYAKGFSRQYAKEGFTDKNNVTGKLEEKMKLIEPSYGFSDTKIWQLIPTPTSGVEGPPSK